MNNLLARLFVSGSLLSAALPLVACVDDGPDVDADDLAAAGPAPGIETARLNIRREALGGDLYHYEFELPLSDGPHGAIRMHRVVRERWPYVPRPTHHAAMLLHGDFATFTSNFVPGGTVPGGGLAPYLASRGVDVWGVDRRWALAGPDPVDPTAFAAMGVAQELDDLGHALALARGLRTAGGGGAARMALVGFSHGAQLAYAYAAVEAARPPGWRHVDALVPIDFYGAFAPEDEDLRVATCEAATFEAGLVAEGEVDAPNLFIRRIGTGALTAPDDPSRFDATVTNRQFMLGFVGKTYEFAPFAPAYHLNAPGLDGDQVTGLTEADETDVAAWLAATPLHQPMREYADLDALLCGEGAQPVAAPLAAIEIPLLYLGAAGGIGSLGVYTTTQVSSDDVTVHLAQRYPAARRAEDLGHADLLLGADAIALAWAPLASWLMHH
ncbi:MAG: hypothetical protein KA297_17665 [Kofleriaceae bacterium]|nr:hypothetical protein [Kofleriaceae bacterium]